MLLYAVQKAIQEPGPSQKKIQEIEQAFSRELDVRLFLAATRLGLSRREYSEMAEKIGVAIQQDIAGQLFEEKVLPYLKTLAPGAGQEEGTCFEEKVRGMLADLQVDGKDLAHFSVKAGKHLHLRVEFNYRGMCMISLHDSQGTNVLVDFIYADDDPGEKIGNFLFDFCDILLRCQNSGIKSF
jgi:hypothetical protein